MRILFGLEIETGIRHTIASNIRIGYHGSHAYGSYITKNWTAENDISLSPRKSGFKMVEFVSRPFTKVNTKKVLLELKAKIDPRTGMNSPFKLDLNTTCGAHIHFSWVNGLKGKKEKQTKDFDGVLTTEMVRLIREKAFHDIKLIIPFEQFCFFQKQYYRSYAQKIEGSYLKASHEKGHERRKEFTCTSDKGAEWRSFNLMGATTWNELIKYYEIAVNAVESVLLNELRNKYCFIHYYEIELPKAEIEVKKHYEQTIKQTIKV